jgi:hypothetical protein
MNLNSRRLHGKAPLLIPSPQPPGAHARIAEALKSPVRIVAAPSKNIFCAR